MTKIYENYETIFKLLPNCYFFPMKNSVHYPDGIRFISSSTWHSPWQIMAQNLTFWVRWNLIFPIFSHISPVSHGHNFKAGHGQNSGISPFSFWLLWTLWSGTGVELGWKICSWFSDYFVYNKWLPYMGHDLVGGLEHDFYDFPFHIFSYMGCHPSHWRSHMFQDG